MPLYLYRCRKCDHVFEDLVSAAEASRADAVTCPECHRADAERQLTTFAVQSGASNRESEPFCGRCGENRPPCSR